MDLKELALFIALALALMAVPFVPHEMDEPRVTQE